MTGMRYFDPDLTPAKSYYFCLEILIHSCLVVVVHVRLVNGSGGKRSLWLPRQVHTCIYMDSYRIMYLYTCTYYAYNIHVDAYT